MRHSFLLFFFILCAFPCGVFCQNEIPHFDYITISEGLPHNTVFCTAQDRDGLMWFGTQDGLVRYDAYTCQVFRQRESDTIGFQGKIIHCILEDHAGNLWVGTRGDGINFRNRKTNVFTNLKTEPALKEISKSWINALFEDRDGRIWMGTMTRGLFIYDPKTHTAVQYNSGNSHLKENAILKILADESGTIWVAGSGKGIYFFDASKNDFVPVHSKLTGDTDFESFRKTLFDDGKGNLWIGTEGSGLYRLTLSNNELRRFTLADGLSSNNIMGIAQNEEGDLLLATDGGGLNILNHETQKFTSYQYNRRQKSLNTNALYNVLIDHDQNVWIGTYNGGVNIYKVHKTLFETLAPGADNDGESSQPSVLSLCNTSDGSIYVGTDGGGLNLFHKADNSFGLIVNKPAGYGNVVKAIFEDLHQQLWMGYFNDGLSYYNRKDGSFRHYRSNPEDSTGISGNNVWSIAQADSGKLWLGILGGGVNLFDPETGRFKRYVHRRGDTFSISSDDVMTVFADKGGSLWAGTATAGLNLLDKTTGHFTHFMHNNADDNSISANDIRCIYQDTEGRIWIGTESGGLNLWSPDGQFTHFTTENGLISNALMGIVEDDSGYIWLSTFRGISRLDPKSRKFLNFDFHHYPYLNANQFNQASILADKEGVLYFGGINGMLMLRPENVHVFESSPNVIFTDFKVFNKSVPVGLLPNGCNILSQNLQDAREIHLRYSDNVFSFEFATLDYTEPFKNKYAYRMDGFDREWRTTGSDQRIASYTNLDPGTYTFRVKGTNSYGVWSDEKTIKVIIDPPFWKTWWFNMIIVLFLAGLAWLALRVYLTRREMALRQRVLESERSILKLKNENLISEQTILQLQNEKLEVEVKAKSAELMSNAVQTAHKNEILIGVKEQLESIQKITENQQATRLIRSLKSTLNTEIEGEKGWEQFTSYFDQVNQNFITQLLKKHPSLTQNDLRMCALTKLNMSNKEMAALLNISVPGVEKSRYRLKKHLNLTPDDDLAAYLRTL